MDDPQPRPSAENGETVTENSLPNSLLEFAGELQYFAVQILSATVPGTFENTFAGPAIYAAEHARRLARILSDDPAKDIDAVAWSARCLYETRMTLFHLLSHPKLEAESLLSHWVDQGDVLIAKTITDIYSDSESEKQTLEAELKKFGRPPLPKAMAELTGCLEEHRMMYGLLCLYTHPSKFLLFGSPQVARNKRLADVFGERALYYLGEVHQAIAYVLDHVGQDGIEEGHPAKADQNPPNGDTMRSNTPQQNDTTSQS